MESISILLKNEIKRLDNLPKLIQSDIDNFDETYDSQIKELLTDAQDFDVESAELPDRKSSTNKNNLFIGASQFVQGGATDIATYVGAFRMLSGSVGLIGKGLKNLFRSSSKIHFYKIPENKLQNIYRTHNVKSNDKPYVLIENGEDGKNSVIFTRFGISISNDNLTTKNLFFSWYSIEKFDLKQYDETIYLKFNDKDNVNLKYFYEGSQSKLGLLFYIAESIKRLNRKPQELREILPKIDILKEKLINASNKIDGGELIPISDFSYEYRFQNINSFLFYKITNAELSNIVKIIYTKFNEGLSQIPKLSSNEIIQVLKQNFNTEISLYDIDKVTKEKIETKLQPLSGSLSKHAKLKEFITTIENYDLTKISDIKQIYDEIKSQELPRSAITQVASDIEKMREEYFELKRKKSERLAGFIVLGAVILLVVFVLIMQL